MRDRPGVIELQRFAAWLEWHAAECAAQVDTWMVSSLPVPTGLLARVWPDEAWQSVLRDIVVVGDGPDEVGFLPDADGSGALRVVDLDGETVRLNRPWDWWARMLRCRLFAAETAGGSPRSGGSPRRTSRTDELHTGATAPFPDVRCSWNTPFARIPS
ncbi:DUF4132 domain-containing protein [Streptomyces griseoloalbus]|uniref:DUF4132 domain-containing protein n=1 Tax=Streptomyces griseoloalbus TaxID=67303 RepID=UPI003F53F6A4